MPTAFHIATEEWRYWSRTKLGGAVALLALILICISIVATLSQQTTEKETRESLQIKAEETFRDQPARHPHRMVHYGHYVFRAPSPLAALDPGVDPYTGTVVFLEGHRQNSATFSPSYVGAQAGPFASLTPSFTYQLLIPLILIILGFGLVAREREAATDRQLVTTGISPTSIWFGKTLALLSVAFLLLLPLLVGVLVSTNDFSVGLGFFGMYALYLFVWVLIVTAISTWSNNTSIALFSLLAIWGVLCILAPRLVASTASVAVPTASQIESDMAVVVALRSAGDGHNANDPAFDRLKANLFAQYGVDRVEDLPINFRGAVARSAEAEQTKILNEYAEKRMTKQLAQTNFMKSLEFVSPFLSVQSASMIAAGTDGQTHHRFLREAEAVRFEFVQSLNNAHTTQMTYADDMNRNKDTDSAQRTRISTDNWRVIGGFHFSPDPAMERLNRLVSSMLVMLVWIAVFVLIGLFGARRLPEVDNG